MIRRTSRSGRRIEPVQIAIICTIVSVFAMAFFNIIVNNRAATERRALRLCHDYIFKHGIEAKYVDCAGDSDTDGYGTCTIKTVDNKRIMLMCPSEYFAVEFWGAKTCKEVYSPVDLMIRE